MHWSNPAAKGFAEHQEPLVMDGYTGDSAYLVSNLTAYEMAKGRQAVDFTRDAMENFETPKIRPLNSSAGEQWEFDGVSADGMQSFVFGFYRDPNYAILGTGNFRLSMEFAFAGRTRFYEVYYPERSVVESCPQGTRGMWYDEKDGYKFSFLVNAEMSEAIVTLKSDTLDGKVFIQSKARPPHRRRAGTESPVRGIVQNGVPIFQSTHPPNSSATDDYVLASKTYGGAVTGTLEDKMTGFQLELVSPRNRRHYTFFVEHTNLGFEYILGEGVGGSGFSGRARGGHVGLDQYEGIALSEALTFPQNSPLFRSNYVE
ncbi:hypothetical protein PG995_014206 [Apiospora arundinis]